MQKTNINKAFKAFMTLISRNVWTTMKPSNHQRISFEERLDKAPLSHVPSDSSRWINNWFTSPNPKDFNEAMKKIPFYVSFDEA